ERRELLDLLASIGASEHDRGLRWLLNLMPRQDGLTLVVVTGQPGAGSLGAVSMARHRFQMVTVVEVGGPSRAGRAGPGGGGLSVGSNDEFVSALSKATTTR